jgi:hypothetical protein
MYSAWHDFECCVFRSTIICINPSTWQTPGKWKAVERLERSNLARYRTLQLVWFDLVVAEVPTDKMPVRN